MVEMDKVRLLRSKICILISLKRGGKLMEKKSDNNGKVRAWLYFYDVVTSFS